MNQDEWKKAYDSDRRKIVIPLFVVLLIIILAVYNILSVPTVIPEKNRGEYKERNKGRITIS